MIDFLKPYFNTHVYLVAGYVIGAISVSIHFVPWSQEDITFADIGGMMAGIGTIGIFVITWRTLDDWKRKNLREHMENWFTTSLNYHRVYQKDFLEILFELETYKKEEKKPNFTDIDKEQMKDLKKEAVKYRRNLCNAKEKIELLEVLIYANSTYKIEIKDRFKTVNDLFEDTKFFMLLKMSEEELIQLQKKAEDKERELKEIFLTVAS